MRHCLLSFLLLTCTFPALAGLKQDPNLIKGTLSNGLTYYIYPNDYPKGEAVYRLFIKSGSVYETEEQRGLAHFIEHMAFNGTKHFPGDGIIRFLESKGAKFGVDLNAHTSFNETVYKLQLPTSDPAMVDSTFLILSDWANGLLLDSLEIEQERGVIFSEWLSKSGPEKDAQNAFLMELLNESRYSERIVIGDTGVILGCSHQALRNYYEQWYHPKRMAIAVSGDIDPKQVKALIKKYFSSIKAPRTATPPLYGIPPYEKPKLTVVSHPSLKKIEYNHILLLPPFEPINSKKGYQDYLKRTLLNRLFKARLAALTFEDLPYKNGSASLSPFLNTSGVFLASVELIPGKLDTGLDLFNEHMEQMFRYGFLNMEINKVKKIYLSQLKRKATSRTPTPSETFMNDLYANFFNSQQVITAQTEYKLALKYLPSLDSLTFVRLLKEVIKPAQTRYFMTAFDQVAGEIPSEEKHLAFLDSLRNTTMSPYYKAVDVPDVLLSQQPKSGRVIEKIKIEPIETLRIKLSNGATVYYRKSLSDKGRVQLTGYREGGIYAMDSAAFVSGIYAGSIVGLSGAGAFTRDALSHYLAGNSASVRLLTERNRSGLVANAEIDDVETMFELLYLKWTQPRIDTAVFEQTKRQAIESYRTQNKTASTVFYQDLQYMLNGRTYVTREMTDTLLEQEFQLDWLMPAFQHSFGSADGYTFIVMSDVDYAELEPYILKYLGGLPTGNANTAYVYKGSQSPVKDIDFQRKAGDAPKATVSLIYQGTSVSESMSSFEMKNELMKTVLRTNLLKELREALGMVYSVGVSVSGTKHPADLFRTTIAFSCKPEDVDTLVERTNAVLLRLVNDPASMASVLTDAQKNLIKAQALDQQRDSYWSAFIRNSLYNKDYDWYFPGQFEQRVNAVTPDVLAKHVKTMVFEVPQVKAVLLPKDIIQ